MTCEPRRFITPRNLEDAFLETAAANTGRNIESCALICGEVNHYFVRSSHLVFPRQVGTENTAEMIEDTSVESYLIEKGLSVLGWIHTHPTQTAFLSSVDVHTQFGYQRLLPEAVAVVCAPLYESNKWLRLTGQGMRVIEDCPFRGFHEHVSKSKLFGPALNIVFDESSVEVVDLRGLRVPPVVDTESGRRMRTSSGDEVTRSEVAEPAIPVAEGESGVALHRPPSPPEKRPPTSQPPLLQQVPIIKKSDVPVSKLRRVAVKLEKNRSHRDFLKECRTEGVIPRGFQLNWTCHFDEANEEIRLILLRASQQLVSTCSDLAGKKVERLEKHHETLIQTVRDNVEREEMKSIETVIDRDVRKIRESISRTKSKKLAKLRMSGQDRVTVTANTAEKSKLSPVEVINLSSRQLSPTEQSVLAKGLSFVPSKKQTVAHLTAELKEWERLMRLREFWHGKESSEDIDGSDDDKSTKIPDGRPQKEEIHG